MVTRDDEQLPLKDETIPIVDDFMTGCCVSLARCSCECDSKTVANVKIEDLLPCLVSG
jgi:hypothetical protein